jgi:hypothetical protein
MKRYLLLTVDHEIFGNGTGDVRQHVTGPTERMCRIAERFEIPITIFFEAEEYDQFERDAAELRRFFGYDPAREMRQQAQDLSRRGHDIQLHLHPQWYKAERVNGSWLLHDNHLTVDALFETADETTEYIGQRRAALEEITGTPVIAYRAGGFAAQPGQRLLKALAENGFKIESSVVKGMHRPRPHPIDYRGTPVQRRHWRVSDEVSEEDPSGPLWEVPVYSTMGRRFQQLTFSRLKAKFSRNVPKERQREMIQELGVGRNPASLLSFLGSSVPIKLDFHNLTPAAVIRMIKQASPPPEGDLDVLVLIGHSKEHINDLAFEELLRRVAADPSLEVITMTTLAALLGEPAAKHNGAKRARV